MVHYEKLKQEPKRELGRIFEFFGIKVSERRLECFTEVERLNQYKRHSKSKVTKEMFPSELVDAAEETIRALSSVLLKYGFQDLPLETHWT